MRPSLQRNPSDAANAPRLVSIEAGGTKFNIGIGGPDGQFQSSARFATRSPSETLGQVTSWLDAEIDKGGPIAAIGLATFGPIHTDPSSSDWGLLGLTPKLSWRGVDMLAPFRRYGIPLGLDTDVNGAALAEWRWGAGRGRSRICYLTVGTGIGGGAVLDGKMLSGVHHPEMGHMFVRRHRDDDFAGACPVHGDCLEGLASGNAIAARWGGSLSGLEAAHPGHALIANYLAQACVNIVATLAPEKIILGGGVMTTAGLLGAVHEEFQRLANGYFSGFGAEHIALAELFPLSGLAGGLAIADMAMIQHASAR